MNKTKFWRERTKRWQVQWGKCRRDGVWDFGIRLGGSTGILAVVEMLRMWDWPSKCQGLTVVLMWGGEDGEHPTSLGLLFTLASGPGRSKMQSNPACPLALPFDCSWKRDQIENSFSLTFLKNWDIIHRAWYLKFTIWWFFSKFMKFYISST